MSWTSVLTLGFSKIVPPIYKILRGRIKYKHIRKAIDDVMKEFDLAQGDGVVTKVEWCRIIVRFLAALVISAKELRD